VEPISHAGRVDLNGVRFVEIRGGSSDRSTPTNHRSFPIELVVWSRGGVRSETIVICRRQLHRVEAISERRFRDKEKFSCSKSFFARVDLPWIIARGRHAEESAGALCVTQIDAHTAFEILTPADVARGLQLRRAPARRALSVPRAERAFTRCSSRDESRLIP